jgi:hypothetical protein
VNNCKKKSQKNLISEPIGSAAPKFSQETKNLGFVRPLGVTLSLLCAAQGFPIPAYRLVKRSNFPSDFEDNLLLILRNGFDQLNNFSLLPCICSSIQAYYDKNGTKICNTQNMIFRANWQCSS